MAPFASLLAALATAAILAGAGPWLDPARPSELVLVALVAAFPYALLVRLPLPAPRVCLAVALSLAGAAGALLCTTAAGLSDDLYRHSWDGKLLAHGLDPYAHVPDSPALSDLRDADWARINHRELATIYPPLSQLAFAAGYRLVPGPSGQRVLALAGHLCMVVALYAALMRRRQALGPAAPHAGRAVLLLALNPLALLEAASNGHIDALLGGCVLGFALWSARPHVAALWSGAASGFKLVGIALAPLLWRRSRSASLLALLLGLACLWPLTRAGDADRAPGGPRRAGLVHYASRWQGNAALFGLLQQAAELGVRSLPDSTAVGAQEVDLRRLAPLWSPLSGTALDPSPVPLLAHKAPRPPGVWPRTHLSGLLARLAAAGLWVLLVIRLVGRGTDGARATRVALLSMLLLSPQFHPWYLLWLLPLELAVGGYAGLLWSVVALSAYAPIDHWVGSRHWLQTPLYPWVQCIAVIGAALWELRVARDPSRSVDQATAGV